MSPEGNGQEKKRSSSSEDNDKETGEVHEGKLTGAVRAWPWLRCRLRPCTRRTESLSPCTQVATATLLRRVRLHREVTAEVRVYVIRA